MKYRDYKKFDNIRFRSDLIIDLPFNKVEYDNLDQNSIFLRGSGKTFILNEKRTR